MADINKLKKIFGLKNLNNEITNVIAMIFSNSKLAGEVDNGYFIARQKFRVYDNKPLKEDRLKYNALILKKKETDHGGYISCKSEVFFKQQLHAELYTNLVKKENSIDHSTKEKEFSNSENMKEFTSFLPKQIMEFSRWSGDTNSIHHGERPIVQGMLLLLTLEDYLDLKGIQICQGDIRYLKPIRASEDIFIVHEKNKIIGIVNNRKCFVLKYKEDNNV